MLRRRITGSHPRMTHNGSNRGGLPSVSVPPLTDVDGAAGAAPATAAARRLVRAHLVARDYATCIDAATVLTEPAALDGDAALWMLSALAVAESYHLLPPDRMPAAATAVAQALGGTADAALRRAGAEAVLAWCTTAGEWCERHGHDAPFARLAARAAAVDAEAPVWARVAWRVAAAWHHESWGRFAAVRRLLDDAAALSAAQADDELEIVVGLKRARLALARDAPANALVQAGAIEQRLPPGDAPLWHADIADIRARAALARGDPAGALHQARLCDGLALQARAPASYTVTYRVNEAYALLALGDTTPALALLMALAASPMPQRLQRRVELLGELFSLVADDRGGRWGDAQRARLRALVRGLRELDWTGVLALLPGVMARLWALALEAGIEADWVRAAIVSRHLAPPEPAWPEAWPWPLRLRVLGGFELRSPGPGGAGGVKSASRPFDLLRRLAAECGLEPTSSDALAAALWPGEGREGRHKALETTLARLRRQLGDSAALRLSERRLRLDGTRVWLDTAALRRQLALIDAGVESGRPERLTRCAHDWQEALQLWRGPLLADEGPDEQVAPWLLAARTQWRQRMAASLLASAALPGHEARCLRALAADAGLQAWLQPPAPGG
jgi:hypothetical protein